MATVELPKPDSAHDSSLWENGITLRGVSWETYESFVEGLNDQRVFVTYDDGTMEIQTMSPSRQHENPKDLITGLIFSIRLLKGIPIESGGSTTHRRQDLKQGAEPDACFWIQNEEKVRGVGNLDLAKYPPPDLVVEVDIHASSISRIQLFAKLGVPEVWRIDGDALEFLSLSPPDEYQKVETSRVLPMVEREPVERAIGRLGSVGETAALNQLIDELKLR